MIVVASIVVGILGGAALFMYDEYRELERDELEDFWRSME